ncbi:MAG TPA: helix-turn-helix transcriptional regulator [Terriglobales bacterium]|nr:helix-turn-helix transcriptional regulator [Terriglobales bacterium]
MAAAINSCKTSRRLIEATECIWATMHFAEHGHFDYDQNMNAQCSAEVAVSQIASAIGEPARARILYCLVDGRARTATELAVVADVSPSTGSSHLQRLVSEKLVSVCAQGKHRYYSLQGPSVAAALEALSVVAGESSQKFAPSTPKGLRLARTCYDHIAGTLGVLLHDRFRALRWLSSRSGHDHCDLTAEGAAAFEKLGVDVAAMRNLRRRFAYSCVDWSERRPHLGGALGAAVLKVALRERWVVPELDSRALRITNAGRRQMLSRFGLSI